MANPNANRTLVGYAISSNSILQKIETLTTESNVILASIETIVRTSATTMRGLSAAIAENTKVLKDIRAVLSGNKKNEKKLSTSIDMKKLAGAAGLIAVAGFGVFTLGMAFQSTSAVTPEHIIKSVAIIATLIPIGKIFNELMSSDGAGMFSTPRVIKNLTFAIIGIAGLTSLMALAIANLPNINGNQLTTLLAVSAAIYIQGKIFVELIKAWEFKGFINKYLNKNNTNEIMVALTIMTLNTIIIANAMHTIPSVSNSDAVSFVIATTALIPMAAAMVTLRFAMPALNTLKPAAILKFGGVVTVMAAAMIPIALAAKAIGKISITDKEIETMMQFVKIMIPIGAVVGLMSAIVNFARESQVGRRGPEGTSLLKQDNSRKRRAELRPKQIKQFTLIAGLVLVGLALLAPVAAYAIRTMSPAINAMASVDFTGLFKFILIVGLATMLMGGAIAMVMSAMKGGGETSSVGIPGLGGKRKTKGGKIGKTEIIAALVIIPIIIVGLAMAAIAWALMPDKFPEIKDPGGFLLFTLVAGFAINIFALALGTAMRGLGKMNSNALLAMTIAIPVIALGILVTSYLFKALPDTYKAPDAMWSLKVALPLVVFAGIMWATSKFMKKFKKKLLMKVAQGIIVAAAIIFVVGHLLAAGPDVYRAPEAEWTGKAALSLLVFGALMKFAEMAKLHTIEMKDMGKLLLVFAVAALAIVIVSHIFTLMPEKIAIPLTEKEAIAMGAVLGAVGLAMYGLSKIPLPAIGIGLVGIIAAALGLLIAGWIISFLAGAMPDLKIVAQGFTDIVMMPFNGMIDLFARLKNEVGVENLVDLAIGIAALGGGLIVFGLGVAALGTGGAVGSVGNLFGAVMDWASGAIRGEEQDTSPMGILRALIRHKDDVFIVASGLREMGDAVLGFQQTPTRAVTFMAKIGALMGLPNKQYAANAQSFMNNAAAIRSIAKSSNMMNVEALDSTTKMFTAIKDLVMAKPESTLMIFTQQLLVAVKELSEAVAALEKTNADSGTTIGDAVSGFIGKASDAILGKAEEVKKKAKEVEAAGEGGTMDLAPLITAIENLEARFDMSIKVVDVTPIGQRNP